jgi:hypothetical protein
MISVSISNRITAVCPQLTLGLILCSVENSTFDAELWHEMNLIETNFRSRHALEQINKIPAIQATRAAYKTFGKDPNRYRPSTEALCRRIVRELPLYQINTLVDLINLISIQTGYSIGGFDAVKVEGDLLLTLGSWKSVEKAADGKDIDNRTFISRNRMKIKDAVAQWNHPVPAAQKETDNLLNKEQISKIMMLKDSVIKSLAPALPHLLSLLQNININLLTDQPDTLLEKEYNKEAVVIVSHALDSLTDAMLQIVGILSTEQKQKIKDAMKEPNAPKDIISLIMQSLNQGK